LANDDRDAVDALYGAKPEEFTVLRATLADAAKDRGDAAGAKRISALRKPTTAAWILNTIARIGDAPQRLADLAERLRTAHAAMDGDGIRALSAAQRKLIDELIKTGLAAAGLRNPSAALRDDITGTLQAAVADPDVLARLGQLAKAERWSGFGEFGSSATVFTESRPQKAGTATTASAPARSAADTDTLDRDKQRAADERDKARAVLAEAQRVKAVADDEMSTRQEELTTARRQHDEARAALRAAERDLETAKEAADEAESASQDAARLVSDAKTALGAKGR
jgi:hypothetical protein